MKILKMTATFGGLENESMTLKSGLNIITAPNESGKSTWSAFVKAMLYGIDTSQRDSAKGVADKNRYRPWSGAVMKGTMEVQWQGRNITIERKSRGNNLLSEFSARETKSGAEVEELNAQNCGEKLLGVTKDVFERSAFIRQAGVSFGKSNDLERRLMAMVTTGEEGVSFSEADAILSAQQNQRRYNRTGELPALENELAEIDTKLENMRQVNQKIVEQTGKIERLTVETERLQEELTLIRQRDDVEKLSRLRRTQDELQSAQNARRRLMLELEGLPEDVTRDKVNAVYRGIDALEALEEQVRVRTMEQDAKEREPIEEIVPPSALKGMKPATAWDKAKVDTDKAQALRRRMKIKKPPVIALSAALGVALLFLIISLNTEFIQTYIPAVLLGVLAAALGGYFLWSRNDGLRASNELTQLLSGYGCDKIAGILDGASAYREKLLLAEAKKDQLITDRGKVTAAQEDLKKKRTALHGVMSLYAPGKETTDAIKAELERILQVFDDISAAEARISAAAQVVDALGEVEDNGYTLSDLDKFPQGDKLKAAASLSRASADLGIARNALSMYTGEQRAMGDPAELQAKREALMQKHASITGELNAIEVARQVLRQGSDELQSKFAPAINARAGELMSELTEGKYSGVIFDKNMDALVQDEGDGSAHKANLLSGGTSDQLYLAIRLAICELALPKEEPVPLVLDDALVNFDDQRMELAINLLKKEAKQRQIILFTCHDREKNVK